LLGGLEERSYLYDSDEEIFLAGNSRRMRWFVEQAQFVFITLLVGTIGDHETELAAHSGMLNVFR